MSRYRTAFVVLVVIVIASTLLALANPFTGLSNAQNHGGGPQVTVVNTLEEPVPTTIVDGTVVASVSGEVNVGNFPATQEVTGVVSVDNFPSSGSQVPVQAEVAFADNQQFQTVTVFSVPAGKRLVIERVSAELPLPGGTIVRTLRVGTTVAGVTVEHSVPVLTQVDDPSFDQTHLNTGQAVRLYADAETDVVARLNLGGTAGGSFVGKSIQISGYLEDMP